MTPGVVVCAAVGVGTAASWEAAARNAIRQARDGVATSGGQPRVGFLYITDVLVEHAEAIRAMVVEMTGVEVLSGSVGVGVCATRLEIMGTPGVVLLLLDADPDQFMELVVQGESALFDGPAAHPVTILHAAPDQGFRLLQSAAGSDAFLVGALSSSRTVTVQFHTHATVSDGATALLLGDDVEVLTGLSQGCAPLGPLRTVTRTLMGQPVQLDGRPALEVLLEDAGVGDVPAEQLRPELLAGRVFVGVQLPGRDIDDYVVRNLAGIDPSEGAVVIPQRVHVGTQLRFVTRDERSARVDLQIMLERLARRQRRPPKAALYFSCVARGQQLFGRPGVELELIADVLGDVPLAGFFGNGEVSHDQVYGYTGVLLLLY